MGWLKTTLGEVFDVRDGTHDSPKYQESGYPLVTSKNLKNGEITLDKIKYISESDFIKINQRSAVQIGDVLFAMIGTIGNPVVIKNPPRFAIKNVALFKEKGKCDSHFLKYYLESPYVIEKMSSEAKGTTQKFVGLGYLRAFPLSLPTIPEQERIVTILDQVFAEIEKARATAETNLENARELFDSYLQQVFGQRGEGWENKKWAEILEIKNGKNQKAVESSAGKYPVIGSAGKVMAYADDYICDEGTTIIGRKGTINNPIFIDTKFWNVDTAFGLQALDGLDKKFLYYFCLSYDFTERDKGSGRPSLVKSDLLTMVMPVPEIDEQRRLVSEIERLNSLLADVFSIYEKKLNCLDELKKSILHKAFTGELTKSKGIAA